MQYLSYLIPGYDPAMLILPSVQQWAPSYNLYTKERPNKLAFVFPSAAAATNIKIRFSGNEVTASASPLTDVKGKGNFNSLASNSKKDGKDQATIQSSTTPDTGYHMGT